jgi:hypothetical protein
MHSMLLPRLAASSVPSSSPDLNNSYVRTSSSSTAHSTVFLTAGRFRQFLRQLFREDWVAYAEPPFGGLEHVLNYLAR